MLPRSRHLGRCKAGGSRENAGKSVPWTIRTNLLHQPCHSGFHCGCIKKHVCLLEAGSVTNFLHRKQAQRSPQNSQLNNAKMGSFPCVYRLRARTFRGKDTRLLALYTKKSQIRVTAPGHSVFIVVGRLTPQDIHTQAAHINEDPTINLTQRVGYECQRY